MKLRKGPYQPKQGDKITVNNFLHLIVSDVFADNETSATGFRQDSDGICKPYDDEMSAKEIEKLLSAKGGRVYREDENLEYTVVLSAS